MAAPASSALFFADRLLKGKHGDGVGILDDAYDGHVEKNVRWGPSHSPENAYVISSDGSASSPMTTRYLSYDVALDLGIVAQTFRAVAEGAKALKALGRLSEADSTLVARLEALRERLPNAGVPRLDENGELAEWWDYDTNSARTSADPGHRHFSHLYPLHPGDGIDPTTTPSLQRQRGVRSCGGYAMGVAIPAGQPRGLPPSGRGCTTGPSLMLPFASPYTSLWHQTSSDSIPR